MLTLAEEFTLLALDRRSGDFRKIQTEYLHAGVLGAAVMELALEGRIDSDVDRAFVVDASPTGNACLDPVLTAMAQRGFPDQLESVIGQLMPMGENTIHVALDSLCARNILTRSETRNVLLKKVTRHTLVDSKALAGTKQRLARVLRGEELPEPRDVCLMTLAKTCGLLDQIVPETDMQTAFDLLSKFSGMDLIGQSVRRYLYLFERDMAQ